MTILKNNLLLVIVCTVTCIGIAGFVAFSVVNAATAPTDERQLTSGAVAVMTIPVEVIDGRNNVSVHGDEFYYPRGIALAEGVLIVADSMSDRIQIISDMRGNSNIIRLGKPGNNNISYSGLTY
jgi:hypothetical protein